MESYFIEAAEPLCERVRTAIDNRQEYAVKLYAVDKLMRSVVPTWALAPPYAFDRMWSRLVRALVVDRGLSLDETMHATRYVRRSRRRNADPLPTPSIDVLLDERRALLAAVLPTIDVLFRRLTMSLIGAIIDADARRIKGCTK